jgi:hypothetical protein
MRKLAREVVIFMLLTPVLFTAMDFSVQYLRFHRLVSTLPKGYSLGSIPCESDEKYVNPEGTLTWECQNGVRTIPVIIGGIDLTAGLVPKGDQITHSDIFLSSLWFGLYGIPAGFGLWVLYRLIRFAVNG